MCLEERCGVADVAACVVGEESMVKTGVRQVCRDETCTQQRCVGKIGSNQTCILEIGLAQVCADKLGSFQIGRLKIDIVQLCARKVLAGEPAGTSRYIGSCQVQISPILQKFAVHGDLTECQAAIAPGSIDDELAVAEDHVRSSVPIHETDF